MSSLAVIRSTYCQRCPQKCSPWLDGTINLEDRALACPIGRWGSEPTDVQRSLYKPIWQPQNTPQKPLRPTRKKGPGDSLAAILKKIGFKSTSSCACNAHAERMNKEGIEWCKNNVPLIASWLKEEANRKKIPAPTLAIEAAVRAILWLYKED